MAKVQAQKQAPVSVRHRDGWCATKKKTTFYANSIKTLCNMYVSAPWGIEFAWPDCPDCCRILGIGEDDE